MPDTPPLHTTHVRPEDAPVTGPLAAIGLHWEDWRGADGPRVLYADLDLAERADLRRALGLARTARPSDLDLVRAAFQHWGADAPDHLGGQFAVAVWDGSRVIAARDPIGLRPLVWARTPGGLVLGGDLRAVLAADGVAEDLDGDILVAALLDRAFDPVMVGRTHFRSIDELRGGHRLLADAGGARTDRYWRPEDAPRLALRGIDETGDALRELLREVTAEAVADAAPGHAVGGHLSSGLDSSTIMALAAEAAGRTGGAPPTAFPWQPPPGDAPLGEHDRIAALVDRWGFPLVWCPPTVEDHLAQFRLDPTRDPVTMWAAEAPVRRAAAAAGVATLLSGWGGDEGVSYTGRGLVAAHLMRQGGWRTLAASLLRDPVHAARRLRRRLGRRDVTEMRPSLDVFRQAALRGERQCFVRPDVLRRAHLPDLDLPPDGPRAYQAWLLLRGHLGRRASDWARAGAPLGLRYRYPLLDRRVLAFAQGLPPDAWLSQRRYRRWPLRAAADGLMPDAVRFGVRKLEPAWQEVNQTARATAMSRLVGSVTSAEAGMIGEYVDAVRLQTAILEWEAAWKGTKINPGGDGLHAVVYFPSSQVKPWRPPPDTSPPTPHA